SAANAPQVGVLFLFDDQRSLRAHDAFAIGFELARVDRGIGDGHDIVLPRAAAVAIIAGAGELVDAVNVVLDLARHATFLVEVCAADGRPGERPFLAEEDAAGVELVAAELGHEAAAGAVVEPPADQFLDALVAELTDADLFGIAAILGADDGRPRVGQRS